ncbi:MAG: leucine-rich repeat protein [Coprobacillaceae bacterium]
MKRINRIMVALVMLLSIAILNIESVLASDQVFEEDGVTYYKLENEGIPGEAQIGFTNWNPRPTSLTIPSHVTNQGVTYKISRIGMVAFREYGLVSLSLPDTITTIGMEAFAGNNLTEVALPKNLEFIGDQTFGNNQLTEISLPKSITWYAGEAFKNNNITTVYLESAETLPLVTQKNKWNQLPLNGCNSDAGIVDIYAPEVVGNYSDTPLVLEKEKGENIVLSLKAEASYKQVERFDDGADTLIGIDIAAAVIPYTTDLSVQWYCDGIAIPGATSTTYTGIADSVGNHTYYATVLGQSLGEITVSVNEANGSTSIVDSEATTISTVTDVVKTHDTMNVSCLSVMMIVAGIIIIIIGIRRNENMN